MTPGEYPGLPMHEYLALPAIGSGVIKAINDRCPMAAWHESYLNPHRTPDPSKESDAGELAHALVLEGSDARVCVVDPQDYPAATTGNIPDGWTNKAIKAVRDEARCAGKVPVLLPQWSRIKAMADSARAFIDSLRTTEPAIWRAFQPGGGDAELTALWDEAGTLCRLRTDRVSTARDLVVDLKFTGVSAEPESFGRNGLLRMQYAISAGFYRRGLRALHGTDVSYLFIVIEQDPPYLCSLVGLDPTWTAYADARVARGLRDWQACSANQKWPGYPARAVYPELPPWEIQRFEEQEIESPWGGGQLDYAKLTGREAIT